MTTAFFPRAFQNNAFQIDQSGNTPGRLRRLDMPGQVRRTETDAEKLARRIEQGTIVPPPAPPSDADLYAKESARLALGIQRFRTEAEESRQAIAALEAMLLERSTEQARRDLLNAQQALQLAVVREAVLLEEMEVLDIAYLVVVGLAATIQ